MSIQKLALTLALGLAGTSFLAMGASGKHAPIEPTSIESKQAPAAKRAPAMPSHFEGQPTSCQKATWPYLPAECIANALPEHLTRSVRIIPIYTTQVRG